jgi:hypothetical protein
VIHRRHFLAGLAAFGLLACTPSRPAKPTTAKKSSRRRQNNRNKKKRDRKKPAPRQEVARAEPTAPRGPSARSVLSSYLENTFAGRHAQAWALLTAEERRRVSRDQYLQREGANDRLRAQVRALGPTRFQIDALSENADEAVAVVTIRSGLGAEATRFVLRREDGKWGIDYQRSWATAR